MTLTPLSMSPHGGALSPLEEAGHGGAGLHLSISLLKKAANVPLEEKCRSVDCCHRQRRDKSWVETCCLQARDEFPCESSQTRRVATRCV